VGRLTVLSSAAAVFGGVAVVRTADFDQWSDDEGDRNIPALIDVVVTRYNEDLGWLWELLRADTEPSRKHPVCYRVFIYDKSDGDIAPFRHPSPFNSGHISSVNVIKTPNIGRDTHTIAHHIHTQYGLRKTPRHPHAVMFLQGEPFFNVRKSWRRACINDSTYPMMPCGLRDRLESVRGALEDAVDEINAHGVMLSDLVPLSAPTSAPQGAFAFWDDKLSLGKLYMSRWRMQTHIATLPRAVSYVSGAQFLVPMGTVRRLGWGTYKAIADSGTEHTSTEASYRFACMLELLWPWLWSVQPQYDVPRVMAKWTDGTAVAANLHDDPDSLTVDGKAWVGGTAVGESFERVLSLTPPLASGVEFYVGPQDTVIARVTRTLETAVGKVVCVATTGGTYRVTRRTGTDKGALVWEFYDHAANLGTLGLPGHDLT